jgi:hypothetical protein
MLDEGSARGLFFLLCFGTLILAKCALAQHLHMRFGMEFDIKLFLWLPSLLVGGVVGLLYIAGPGSPFNGYWRERQFLIPLTLIWLSVLASVLLYLPSRWVVLALAGFFAANWLTVGAFFRLIPVTFLAVLWAFFSLLAAFPELSRLYLLFGLQLIVFGFLPSLALYIWTKRHFPLAENQAKPPYSEN